MLLTSLTKGDKGKIVGLEPYRKNDLQKFLMLGLIPGENIKVILSSPLYVIQVGFTQVALDKEGASLIKVYLNGLTKTPTSKVGVKCGQVSK